MAPIPIALVGGGLFAKKEHMPAINKCDDVVLKVIYSRSLKSAESTAALCTKPGAAPELYAADAGPGRSFEDLLRRDDIAGIVMALPIPKQPAHIEAALAAGKHVLAEKPIAPTVAEAKVLLDKSRKLREANGATYSVAENFRFKPQFDRAVEEIEKRNMGAVTHFAVRMMHLMRQDAATYGTTWRQKPEFPGGYVLDGGVHFAAATRLFLTGESAADSVRAVTSLTKEYLPPMDTVNAVVTTRRGAHGTFQVSFGSELPAFEWDVVLERGFVRINGDAVTLPGPDGYPAEPLDLPGTSGVSEEVAAWAAALVAGKPDPRLSPEEALKDVEFMEKLFLSGEQGGAVQKLELQ